METTEQRSAVSRRILEQPKFIASKLLHQAYQRVLNSAAADDSAMESLLSYPAVVSAGLEEQLRLFRLAHSTTTYGEALFQGSATRALEETDALDFANAIYEYKTYRPNLDATDVGKTKNRIGLLADLLKAPKSHGFRTLKCMK